MYFYFVVESIVSVLSCIKLAENLILKNLTYECRLKETVDNFAIIFGVIPFI